MEAKSSPSRPDCVARPFLYFVGITPSWFKSSREFLYRHCLAILPFSKCITAIPCSVTRLSEGLAVKLAISRSP